MLLLALLVLLVALLAGWRGRPVRFVTDCWIGSVDRADYVARNITAFRAVPVYPGSRLDAQHSGGVSKPGVQCLWRYQEEDYGRPPYKAYWTWRIYRVPAHTTDRSTLLFFGKALRQRGWRLRTWEIRSELKCGDPPDPCHEVEHRNLCVASYQLGTTWLYLEACPRRREIKATVDYKGWERDKQTSRAAAGLPGSTFRTTRKARENRPGGRGTRNLDRSTTRPFTRNSEGGGIS